jgi:superfamily II DNA/RNA helicase
MKPESRAKLILGATRAKAKMYEYAIPLEDHIKMAHDPSELFSLAIGLLGDASAQINEDGESFTSSKETQTLLRFSAYFFTAYHDSRLNQNLDPYALLLASASYYLCDLPGSSGVLAQRLNSEALKLDGLGLEQLVLWLLHGNPSHPFPKFPGPYRTAAETVSQSLSRYIQNGSGAPDLLSRATALRKLAYSIGTPRQLLFADVACALTKTRYLNSARYCLPRDSALSPELWSPALQKPTFPKELWPAQRLLGRGGIFAGKSGVIQMPTSAGKTRAAQIIVRSAFLSKRTSLAVIIAPFRALCHEIKNSLVKAFRSESVSVDEFSDVLQADFDIQSLLGGQQLLVMTPEKLLYVLRHSPELAQSIGLLIYDEGHQFDSGSRGVTYELLLTSLKAMVSPKTQTILLSAVISNAEAINKWLNGDNSTIVTGTDLIPTYRTIAFAHWVHQRGQLQFIAEDNPNQTEFFVPRMIESVELNKLGRETKRRVFPVKEEGNTVALYLALKIVHAGGVAIFCGRKATASSICENATDVYARGLDMPSPATISDQGELARLCYQHEANLGTDATATRSARLGIFAHHGNIPHGIRLTVEHAMKEGLIRFVVCTSTLAQGVNLPIRYLIVTSIYQGTERIKVRDFHNLMGRAGRSGMHIEGSIIFADPDIYDTRLQGDWYRWQQIQTLLKPGNSEPCASTLLSILDPLRSEDRKTTLPEDPVAIIQASMQNSAQAGALAANLATRYHAIGSSKKDLLGQIEQKLTTLAAIESYLMAQSTEASASIGAPAVTALAKSTLAHSLASEDKQQQLTQIFLIAAANINQRVPSPNRRKVFARMLFGVSESLAIEEWVRQNFKQMTACPTQDDLFSVVWEALLQHIRHRTFTRITPAASLKSLATQWIQGAPFHALLKILTAAKARIGTGPRPRKPQLDHVVDICENAFAYDGMLVLGAVTELTRLHFPHNKALLDDLQILQKRLKYGLARTAAIALYELGFADRVLASELAAVVGPVESRAAARQAIRHHEGAIRQALAQYPSYFSDILRTLPGL